MSCKPQGSLPERGNNPLVVVVVLDAAAVASAIADDVGRVGQHKINAVGAEAAHPLSRMTEINLRPFLRPQLDVLFVALNPPTQSNQRGHYFSGRGSRFFRLLCLSGLSICAAIGGPRPLAI